MFNAKSSTATCTRQVRAEMALLATEAEAARSLTSSERAEHLRGDLLF
jgi:hypothetical protein